MRAEAHTETLSRADGSGAGEAGAGPYLFVVLDARRLDAPPARLALAGLDEIAIGRGEERRFTLRGRRAEIELPDAGMSRAHARVSRAFGGWVIEDAGSKNGTLAGGRPVSRAELADGDVIEVGRTSLLFRRSLPFDPGGAGAARRRVRAAAGAGAVHALARASSARSRRSPRSPARRSR